jgi:uncharacterized protein with ParB-like and HNH nuclease domain
MFEEKLKMKVAENTIKNLINRNSYFDIPYFQRYYDWDSFQCKELLIDIKELTEKRYENKVNHFIGMFVFRSKSDSQNSFELIDGQQRITTFFLIAKAINFIARFFEKDTKIINHNEIFNEQTENETKMRLRLNNEQRDQEVFESIILYKIDNSDYYKTDIELNWDQFIKKLKTNKKLINKKSRMFSNFMEILYWLYENINDYNNLVKFNDALFNCDILELDLTTSNDNPQNIFESLNSKSKQLDDCDLIKNYIFMNIPIDAEQKRLYDDYWSYMELHVTRKKMTDFLKYYLMIKLQKYIKEKEHGIFKEFKRNIIVDSVKKAKEVLKNIKEWFYIYLASSNQINIDVFKHIVLNGDKEDLTKYKIHLNKNFYSYSIGYSTLIVMALIGYTENNDNDFDFTKFKSLIKLIDSYIIRWKIIKNQGNLSGPLLKIYQSILENSALDYNLSLKNVLLSLSGQFKFFTDQEFEVHLNNNPIRDSEQTMLLLLIENLLHKKHKRTIYDGILNVEHILPISPSKSDEENRNYDRDVNYIGNLLLIDKDFNKLLGNLVFADKMEKISEEISNPTCYHSNTMIDFYTYINNEKIETWNVKDILSRTKIIAKEILIPATKI